MKISEFAVRRPVTVAMFVIGVLVFGFVSLSRLSVDLFPQLELPQATIATVYPGADPSTVEQEVTRLVESVVSMAGGVRRVTSVSMENVSLVTVQFQTGVDVNAALEELRAQLSALSYALPADAQAPLVMQLDLEQLPVLMLAVTVEGDLLAATERAVNEVRPLLEQVPGVAQVVVVGGAEREIKVLYDPAKLEENGLTPAMLAQFLQLQNAMVPGGPLENNGIRYTTRIGSVFTDVQQIRDLVIGESRLPVQGLAALWPPLLHVKDVAEVVDGVKEPTGYARVDGRPAVLLQVYKRPGANTVSVVQGARSVIERLQASHPELGLTVILDQSVQIANSLRNLMVYGALGAVLAVLVLFLFLRSARSVAVIASAIPLSVVVTFVFLYFAGLNINLMTLGGLALGTGMLVDNAIIVLENIYRLRTEGRKPKAAAVEGAREVAGAVLAATLTTIAVFVPVAFMESFVGQLFKEMGLTVSLALAASLLVALTVVPAMAARLLRRPGREAPAPLPAAAGRVAAQATVAEAAAALDERSRPGLATAYERLLEKALDRKGVVLGAVGVMLLVTTFIWPRLGVEFLPQVTSRTVYVEIKMPAGTPLAVTDEVAREAERRLMAMPELGYVAAQVGQQYSSDLMSLLQSQQTNAIQIVAHIDESVPAARADAVRAAVKARLADLPVQDLSVRGEWSASASFFGRDIVLQVRGIDAGQVEETARALAERLQAAVGGLGEVRLKLGDAQPELLFAVDPSRALIGGLSTAQISLGVRYALTGIEATQLRQDGRSIPVVVRPHPAALQDLDDLLNYRVTSPVVVSLTDTTAVRLANIASVVEGTAPQTIRRVDGARVAEVEIRPAQADVRELRRVVAETLASFPLPEGVSIRQGGLSELLEEGLGELRTALLLSLAMVYMVMAAQFESWRYPLIVMVTVPLAAVGTLWALFLTGTNLGVASLMGVIILCGIVVNNGIVLVDYTNQLIQRGLPLREAVTRAARTRLRPVLMTAITTVGGLLPSALVKEQGVELQGPIAVAVIGGLTVSTLLTLFVVPVLYMLFSGSTRREEDDEPATRRAPAALAVALACILGLAGFGPRAHAQADVTDLNVLAGAGYPAGEQRPVYMVGAGWRVRWADTDWRLHFASVSSAGQAAPVVDTGLQGSWFQPISFAGYYELQGRLTARRAGAGPFLTALRLQADAVLGNLSGQILYDSIDAGFPTLPWDPPLRPVLAPSEPAFRRLSVELREQPHRELNLLREFQWSRLDGDDNLLLASGGEIRISAGWLMGKVGLVYREGTIKPLFAGGFRTRPGSYSYFAITASSPTAVSAYPTLATDFEYVGERATFSARMELALQGAGIQPSLYLERVPHAQGFLWRVSLGPSGAEKSATFGLFASF